MSHAVAYIHALDLGENREQLQLEPVVQQLPAGLLNGIRPTIGSPARIHSIAGRWLLWTLLREALPTDIDNPSIQVRKYGKPAIMLPDNQKAAENLSFSISHAGNQVVVILTDQCTVGIDIEHRSVFPYEDCRMVFAKTEWDQILSDKGNHTFYRFWTAKEAICKAEGVGLFSNLPSLDLSGWPAGADQYILTSFPGSGRPWYLQCHNTIPDYTLSLATSTALTNISLQWKTFRFEDIPIR